MFAYIVRRLFLMLVTLFGISVIIFVLLRVVPGNIVDILFDAAGFVDPADKANLERELGLSQPIVIQYLHWIGGLLHGDLVAALQANQVQLALLPCHIHDPRGVHGNAVVREDRPRGRLPGRDLAIGEDDGGRSVPFVQHHGDLGR